jgi:hypothetical protein
MAVLSDGVVAPGAADRISKTFGIDLNEYHFCGTMTVRLKGGLHHRFGSQFTKKPKALIIRLRFSFLKRFTDLPTPAEAGASRRREPLRRRQRFRYSGFGVFERRKLLDSPASRWQVTQMNEDILIDHLEELAEGFGIQIRYEPIKQDEDSTNVVGGLCLLKGEYVLIINSKARVKDRINALAMAVKHFDLDQVYIRPVLRELLDRIPEQKPFSVSGKQNSLPNPGSPLRRRER